VTHWWPESGPFCLRDKRSYEKWRESKLADYPARMEAARVTVRDLAHPSETECAAIRMHCGHRNMALYDSGLLGSDPVRARLALRRLAAALNLRHAEDHRSMEADGIVAIEVCAAGGKAGYIPYSNKAISWHTDGYYNFLGAARCVQAMVLHCVRDAPDGGVNSLLDHEIAYIRLRDEDPALIEALMHPEAMTIPPGEEAGHLPRPENRGPVFFVEPKHGALVMRFTARKRNAYWRDDRTTHRAAGALANMLESDPHIVTYKLRPGEGIVCNNVLHCRSAFVDTSEKPGRLLYRIRYYDRVSG
jgi:alpha-ketoglutarate-dependent taurine dioxygenase